MYILEIFLSTPWLPERSIYLAPRDLNLMPLKTQTLHSWLLASYHQHCWFNTEPVCLRMRTNTTCIVAFDGSGNSEIAFTCSMTEEKYQKEFFDDVWDGCLDVCTIDHHWWYNMIWQGRVERWVIDMMPQYMVLRSTWTHTHSPFPRLVPCSRTRRTSIVSRTSIGGSLFQKWILRRLWSINSWSAKVGWVDNFWCSVCKNLEKMPLLWFEMCDTLCVNNLVKIVLCPFCDLNCTHIDSVSGVYRQKRVGLLAYHLRKILLEENMKRQQELPHTNFYRTREPKVPFLLTNSLLILPT